MRLLACAILIASAYAVAFAAEPLPAQTFAYVAPKVISRSSVSAPPGIRETALRINFPSTGHAAGALLWQPARGTKPHGAVLFVHWLGEPATSNPSEFARDATELARHGVTSLSVQEPWSQPTWFSHLRAPATDFEMSVAIVKDLRATLDLLVAQPRVDAHKLAFVGHDFGAMFGAIMSGVDHRARHYVFIAGTATLREWYLLDSRKPADADAYSQTMSRLDSGAYLSQSNALDYFFQFARNDRYIPLERAFAFFNAAPQPRTMAIYDATHAMQNGTVFRDRIAWLSERLQ